MATDARRGFDRLDEEGTVLDGRRQALRLPALRIDVIEGPDAGASLRIQGRPMQIGSSPRSDLLLEDPTVSRHHARISLTQSGPILEDLESRNGTWVGDLRVYRIRLAPGTRIRIGRTVLVVDVVDEAIDVPISPHASFGSLLGTSVEMRRMFALLERVANTDVTVLVQGETGTGKELVAEAIHARSGRADGPFVVVDCGAIAPTLVESTLFGHVKGAFTGANADAPGAFEEADGGTIFLDELGELPLAMQPKLLRVLESRRVARVGQTRLRSVDVRVIAATHRPLDAEVNAGRFREDLYYRLAVAVVEIPPLRTRREDIPALVDRFAAALRPRPEPSTLAALAARLMHYDFPGNVRELRNIVQRELLLGPFRTGPRAPAAASTTDVPADLLELPLSVAQERWIETFQRRYVEHALARTGGNVTRAAELAGTNRRAIQRILKRTGSSASDGELESEDLDTDDIPTPNED